MHTNYLKKVSLFLLVFALPIGGNWLFLYSHGELLSVEQIAQKQLQTEGNIITGLATRHLGYHYKKALYERLKPTILVLGSSRVMQFKKEFFSDPFLNAGGAMNTLNEGLSFLQEVLPVHQPEVVVIGIDYWWFNEHAIPPIIDNKPPKLASQRISLRSYLLPYKWLYQQKITFKEYVASFNPLNLFRPDWSSGIGVDGIMNNNGFSHDGAYTYTKTVSGKESSIDENFHRSLARLATGADRFEYGEKVHSQHFQQFLNILTLLESHGVKVVLFIPPLAPTVARQMQAQQQNFGFITDLKNKLTNAYIEYADFHDGSLLGTDCEFIDGIHGGDITYAKILRQLGKNDYAFNQYLNVTYLARITQEYPNFAMIPQSQEVTTEGDFLKIGCVKISQSQENATTLAADLH